MNTNLCEHTLFETEELLSCSIHSHLLDDRGREGSNTDCRILPEGWLAGQDRIRSSRGRLPHGRGTLEGMHAGKRREDV